MYDLGLSQLYRLLFAYLSCFKSYQVKTARVLVLKRERNINLKCNVKTASIMEVLYIKTACIRKTLSKWFIMEHAKYLPLLTYYSGGMPKTKRLLMNLYISGKHETCHIFGFIILSLPARALINAHVGCLPDFSKDFIRKYVNTPRSTGQWTVLGYVFKRVKRQTVVIFWLKAPSKLV